MSFSQLFPLFQSSISPPAAAPAAAAANRRVARAPPGTKTARHGRTNRPQNRTEKVPNVPSEFLEKMSFSQHFPLFQTPISSPAAAAAANRRVARAPPGTKTARHGRTNRLQNRTEKLPNLPSEFLEKMSFSQPFPFFQSPISSPAAAAVAAAAVNRRVARAPPGTKTARHGRTNRPQNRTEKLPNIPSEFLEKMFFSQPFPLFQTPISSPAAAAAANRRVARAPPGTKTARHGRTNRPQNRTEKVPNVPSEFLEKMSFSQPFPLFQSSISSPAAAAANRRVARAPPGTKTARHGRTNRP